MPMVRTIVVGAGGPGGPDALAWAAEEAADERTRLVVIRVGPADSALAGHPDEPPRALLTLNQADVVPAALSEASADLPCSQVA